VKICPGREASCPCVAASDKPNGLLDGSRRGGQEEWGVSRPEERWDDVCKESANFRKGRHVQELAGRQRVRECSKGLHDSSIRHAVETNRDAWISNGSPRNVNQVKSHEPRVPVHRSRGLLLRLTGRILNCVKLSGIT
jgi:hypothetical protein